ncbi:MAG TPA: hypothetical protein VK469_04575 [Candidatus Kapabacteria bacterium]|nr:hypothetical protein [Candidatus Kapabacteria bacterium]
MKLFEEKDQYVISVEKEKNRLIVDFVGECNDSEKMPNYNKHAREATKEVSKGYTLFVILSENTKPPKLSLTKVMRECQDDFIKAGVSKTAVYVPPKLILQKMTLTVVTKLSGMNLKVFDNKEKAENWLDEK